MALHEDPAWLLRKTASVMIRVRVTTKASTDAIDSPVAPSDGSIRLAVRVRATPDWGAANRAVTMLLAKGFDLPTRAVRIVAGMTSRMKTIEISGEPAVLAARIRAAGAIAARS